MSEIFFCLIAFSSEFSGDFHRLLCTYESQICVCKVFICWIDCSSISTVNHKHYSIISILIGNTSKTLSPSPCQSRFVQNIAALEQEDRGPNQSMLLLAFLPHSPSQAYHLVIVLRVCTGDILLLVQVGRIITADIRGVT
jgi:hypothetical protein